MVISFFEERLVVLKSPWPAELLMDDHEPAGDTYVVYNN